MNVLFFSPGFPAEMPYFARGLAQVGATVFGLGDQPAAMLPEIAQRGLSDYLRVSSLFDEEAVVAEVLGWRRSAEIDRVECLWEPGMLLAARLRQELGIEGMTIEQTIPFRDKSVMKEILDRAGIRTPRHHRAQTATEVREAIENIGFPVCIKPIAGAGSADTYRVDDSAELDRVLELTRHVPEVSVEEFIEGKEYTFDTICAEGRVLYHNVAWYRPNPLVARSEEWISPQTISLRTIEVPETALGIEMGHEVLRALGFQTGFTHMEWFMTAAGEAVFGEIGARPPGARSVDIMNYASDIDVFVGWAEAVCSGQFTQQVERKYHSAVIFKRAHGQGRISKIEGLDELERDFGERIVCVDLLPIGSARRNWRQTLISDGYLIVRHPDLASVMKMADRVGTDLRLFAQ